MTKKISTVNVFVTTLCAHAVLMSATNAGIDRKASVVLTQCKVVQLHNKQCSMSTGFCDT